MFSYTVVHDGTEVVLIDTPGFNDTFRSETEVLKDIASWLEKTYAIGIKLSGIIYMHALDDRRMYGSSLRNLKMFRQLCGDPSLKNVVMTTSGWDLMTTPDQLAKAEIKETDLTSNPEFWQPMLDKGCRVARFHNDKKSALEIISSVIPDKPVVLKIQHELVDKQMNLVDTAAGVTVNEELIKVQAKYEAQLKEIHEEMKEALADKNEEMKEILEREKSKFERMRDDARRAQDSLRYEQRNAQRRHDNEMQDLRHALEDSRTDSIAQREKDQQALMELQAAKIAEKKELEEIVEQLRVNSARLRKEERIAIEQEIAARQKEKGDKKKRAVKLLCNVAGVVGTVTMSLIGLPFLGGPLMGMM